MGLWGTLIGGTLGFTLGGPLGALLGAALGSSFGDGNRQSRERVRRGAPPPGSERDPNEIRRVTFFVATFGVMGHIAKADGRVSEEEAELARAVMEGLGLGPEERRLAGQLFDQGKSPDFDLNDALDQLRTTVGRRRNLLRAFMDIQLKAAWADGHVHPEERRILDHVARSLGFPPAELARMERMAASQFQRRGASPETKLHRAYEALGLERGASDEDLKTTYRRLMRQNHPDRLAAQGLPEEMKAEATRRTQEIQEAYRLIRDARQ